jgi:hypothetical protein
VRVRDRMQFSSAAKNGDVEVDSRAPGPASVRQMSPGARSYHRQAAPPSKREWDTCKVLFSEQAR